MVVDVVVDEGGFDLGGDDAGDGFDEEGNGGVADALPALANSLRRRREENLPSITNDKSKNGIRLPSA